MQNSSSKAPVEGSENTHPNLVENFSQLSAGEKPDAEKKHVKMITKSNGSTEPMSEQKIKARLECLQEGLAKEQMNLSLIINKACNYLPHGKTTATHSDLGATTQEVDQLLSETAAYLNIAHPHYGRLAARIVVTNLHKKTKSDFFETIHDLYTYVDDAGKLSRH